MLNAWKCFQTHKCSKVPKSVYFDKFYREKIGFAILITNLVPGWPHSNKQTKGHPHIQLGHSSTNRSAVISNYMYSNHYYHFLVHITLIFKFLWYGSKCFDTLEIQNCISVTRLSPTKPASSGDSEQQAEEKVRIVRIWYFQECRVSGQVGQGLVEIIKTVGLGNGYTSLDC